MSAWIVGREYDRSLQGEGRTGLRREYLRSVGNTFGHLSLTTNETDAQQFESRDAAVAARRAAWPKRVRGMRTLVQRIDDGPSQ